MRVTSLNTKLKLATAGGILKLYMTSLLRRGWSDLDEIWELEHANYCNLVKLQREEESKPPSFFAVFLFF